MTAAPKRPSTSSLDARKHGLGKRFYRALEDLSRAQGIYNLYACIGEPQGRGRRTPERTTASASTSIMGFRRIGVFTALRL